MSTPNPYPTVESLDDDCQIGCTDYGAELVEVGLDEREEDLDNLPFGEEHYAECTNCEYLYFIED